MTKIKRRTVPAYKLEAAGKFLMELNDRLILKPDINWNISKKQTREEFQAFLGRPENKHLRKHFPGPQNDVGTLLRITHFLTDTPAGSTYYCIDHQAFLHYREKLEILQKWNAALFQNSSEAHRLPANREFVCTKPLPSYAFPADVQSIVKKRKFDTKKLCDISEGFKDYFNKGNVFTQQNYYDAMKVLLQLEDLDKIRKYYELVQRDVELLQNGNVYTVSRNIYCSNHQLMSTKNRVLIIAENEATKSMAKNYLFEFLLADKPTLTIPGKIVEPTHHGYIESYIRKQLKIVCKTALPTDVTYLIIFRPERLTLRYQYHALKMVTSAPSELVKRLLFPEATNLCHAPTLSLDWITPSIRNNKEQMDAVTSIVDQTPREAPFVVFGPPGTGKTNIIVEAILQLYIHQPHTKILVTAAPNSACDEIALRLCQLLSLQNKPRSKILVRVYSNAQENRRENIDKLVLEYSNMYAWQFFPDIETLHQYRIVICTLSTVGKLMTGDFGVKVNGDSIFTHIFIDEVAAATEAEALVAIANSCQAQNYPNGQTNLIISGDHMQLGPLLNSARAKNLGLGMSLMERLLKVECYQVDETGQHNRRIQARLHCNYRSHPAIVELYSGLFYNNELKAMAPTDMTSLCSKWPGLKNPNFPIIFHSVFGHCQQDTEEGSFSYFNEKELNVVLKHVSDLMSNGVPDQKMRQQDIGIISPYRSQYMYIQDLLNARHLYEIETGSVGMYRGKEKHIIIVSCVRTDALGFLKQPKLINTMLSRAKSLLILVGDPRLLSKDPHYKHIILESQRNNTFIGSAYTIQEKKEKDEVDAEIVAIVTTLGTVMISEQQSKAKGYQTEANNTK